eukprot:350523-Chlamydomonas_euryale.AAC.2
MVPPSPPIHMFYCVGLLATCMKMVAHRRHTHTLHCVGLLATCMKMVPPGPPRLNTASRVTSREDPAWVWLCPTHAHRYIPSYCRIIPAPVLGPHKLTNSPEQRPVEAEREVKEEKGQRRGEGKEGGLKKCGR